MMTRTPKETVALLLQRDRSSIFQNDSFSSLNNSDMTTDMASESLFTEIPSLAPPPLPVVTPHSSNALLIKEKLKKRLKKMPFPEIGSIQKLQARNEALERKVQEMERELAILSQPSPLMQVHEQDVQVDFQDRENLEKAQEMIQEQRLELEKIKTRSEEEGFQNATISKALAESEAKRESIEKTVQTMQSRLKLAKDNEVKCIAEAVKMSQKMSSLTKQLKQTESDMGTLQELYHSIHKDVEKYRKIQGLFPSEAVIFSSILQERQKAKTDSEILESKITDLEEQRKLVKAQRHIKDIAEVSRSQEELARLKEQLQKQKEGMEGQSLVWEETKLKLKLVSEESESLKKKSIQDKKEIKRLLERIESQKLEIRTMDSTVAEYAKTFQAYQSTKNSLEQKLRVLSSQVESKDILLRDQGYKIVQLEEQLEAQSQMTLERESVQCQLTKLKQYANRKDGLVKFWKEKFSNMEDETILIRKMFQSLQDQLKNSCFKLKLLSDKEIRVSEELSRLKTIEHQHQQLLRVLQAILKDFIEKREREYSERQKKEMSETLLDRMKGLSRQYFGLDLPVLMVPEPLLGDQLQEILTKRNFEEELLSFLKSKVFV